MRVCVCGEFNAVRSINERRSTSTGKRTPDQTAFSRFIDDNFMVDLPLCGRKFTWGLSDDCALVLALDEANWGPRPLRMLKCWRDVPGYNLFVKERWRSLNVDGCVALF
ncbi:hypothetical protein QL285_032423 [Trifolium repens]|nr:hypothetical protein QL285_032423 [Trifolium repens]